MSTALQTLAPTQESTEILSELAILTRDHLLHYRLEVGRVILLHFFGNDALAYSDKNHAKQAKFADFVRENAADLALLGLREHSLRECIVLRTVYRTLPAVAQDRLGYSRTLALVAMPDPSMRSQLALAAMDRRWSVAELKQTIGAAKAGLWYVADPETPGMQAAAVPAPVARPVHAGRLVTRAEKWSAELGEFASGWASIEAGKASKLQRARLKKALGEAVARLRAMVAQLGE